MSLPASPGDLPVAFATAWAARDASALAALFAEDADFVNVVGIWWEDRAAIEKAHAYGLRTIFADSRLQVGRVKVRMLGKDHAVVQARLILTGQTAPDGGPAGTRRTILAFVAKRTADGWQAVAAQNTDIVPGAETHLAPADYRG
ncbi:SgcJ/EcaC family oxidoreductase [Pelagovum pacificum]|uniref:SgcJ/EcaC family oxidoreductase n=1 Tax=Pelagovum pacificum TaxID=2588711 RepID=A0A5C5G7N4_9RHOB|nr:SgcJ/EcaC family oxidoreductase [Pelagovum pacificum]QQA41832.1 SgcJ/EcaC family oxidoreductase [Pelagovum pacificum]TNY30724.1 SgcJ/EcaC family oxidoreductase [Pelagovum pacificum]